MKKAFRTFITCCSMIVVLMPYYGCGSSIELVSHKASHPVTIDGKMNDWDGIPVYLEKQKLSLGFLEDDSSLYVLLTTTDRQTQAKLLMTGLTVWFDSTGWDERIVGIHFPLGEMDRERPSMERPTRQESGQEGPAHVESMLDDANTELEIIGPEKDQTRRVLLPSSRGLQCEGQRKGG